MLDHRSFEYSLKWKSLMYTRHSSELQRASKKRPRKSPSRNADPPQRLMRSKRRRVGLRRMDDDTQCTDAESGLDIINVIDSKHEKKQAAEVEEGGFTVVSDKGLDDESDVESSSLNSSIASGPSLSFMAAPVMPKFQRSPRGPCSACLKLYRNAKRFKKPIKDKLLDNDPSSLTCDQWVLLKRRRRGRLPSVRGKLSRHLQMVKGRLEHRKHHLDDSESLCSRPHVFLQRNLWRCIEVPVKKLKKNRRKRVRSDSLLPRISKQKRLRASDFTPPVSADCTDDSGIASASCQVESPSLEASSDGPRADSQEADVTVETIPSAGSSDSSKRGDVSEAPKKTKAFRDLLAQLRGNSSQIINESRY